MSLLYPSAYLRRSEHPNSTDAKCRRMNIRDVLFCRARVPVGGPMTTLEEFSALIAAIYDAALDPALWEQTLKRIAAAAGGSDGALRVHDRQGRRPPHMFIPNLDLGQKRKYDEYYWRIDPIDPFLDRAAVGSIVSCRAVTTEAHRRGEFYNDWATPNEVGDTILVKILDGPDALCNLAVCHPWGSEPFPTPEVLRLVKLLVPHLQRSMQAQLGFGPLSLIRDSALDFGRALAAWLRAGFFLGPGPLCQPGGERNCRGAGRVEPRHPRTPRRV